MSQLMDVIAMLDFAARWDSFLAMGAVLSLGIFIQSAAGFAAGLVIIPLLMFAGFSLPESQCAMLIATLPQNLIGSWTLRDDIPLEQLRWPAVGRLTFLPLGIATLYSLQTVSPTLMRQMVGAVVLAATVAIVIIRPQPRAKLHSAWGWGAFPLSGFTQGLVGMGGPAMVFWVQAHDWGTRRSRGFLFAMYTISVLPALGTLAYTFGSVIIVPSLMATTCIPLLWPVTVVGIRVGTWLGRERLRRVTIGLLFLVGIAGLAAPWMRG